MHQIKISRSVFAFICCIPLLANDVIQENLRLLANGDLLTYRDYCFETISDTFEVGQMLRFLLGPLEGHIRDLRLVDVSYLFKEKQQPNWVSASLIEIKKTLPTTSETKK